uniref:Uncharacterized protein n=1 Tax=Ananas comosus var. bracteatus TaxID=296719 RepID=A0A6V7QD73_ANACO|nr:unnamed protein product [Ananas comosus var. bracteatus]
MAQDQGEAVAIDISDAVLSSVRLKINALNRHPMAPESFAIFRLPLPQPLQPHRRLHSRDQELEPRARQRYFEPVELSADEFVEMLLLDGCFVLEFIIKWSQGDDDSVCTTGWSLPLVCGDLLLLENQIPLFVLEKLFELVTFTMGDNVPTLMELLVNYLASENIESPEEEMLDSRVSTNASVHGEAKDFHHLLHLYYRCYVLRPRTDPTGAPSAAGVTFRKKNHYHHHHPGSFLDVTFHGGVLEIPFLSVNNSTLSLFTNLVAFEQCSGCQPEEAYMTSYATFMNCIIDTPRDVTILQQSGILENQLASDMDLAVFFNEFSNCPAMYYKQHYLAGLFREVRKYCNSDWNKWKAKLVRDYFTYPWPILSLSAAAVILISTLVQTFFAVYSYYHPRK